MKYTTNPHWVKYCQGSQKDYREIQNPDSALSLICLIISRNCSMVDMVGNMTLIRVLYNTQAQRNAWTTKGKLYHCFLVIIKFTYTVLLIQKSLCIFVCFIIKRLVCFWYSRLKTVFILNSRKYSISFGMDLLEWVSQCNA